TLPHRLSRRTIDQISCKLQSFKPYIPAEFNRKTRSLKELDHWKATEFRTFLLYVSPLALADILDKKKYKHFMLLHAAVYILSSDLTAFPDWNPFAASLLDTFVSSIKTLYFEELLTYNMHSLIYFANYIK